MSSGHIRIKPERLTHKRAEPEIRKVSAPKRSKRKRVNFKRVLIKVTQSPIFDIISMFTPKPIRTMLYWIKDRLKEPSTYQGLTTLAAALGYTLNPEAWEAITTLALSVIGMIQVMKAEKPLLEKK